MGLPGAVLFVLLLRGFNMLLYQQPLRLLDS
jgi:hypothetical protein